MANALKFPSLCGKIIEKYGSRRVFAEALGWTAARLSTKLCGKSDWTRAEMLDVLSKLELSSSDIEQYFFNN